MEKVFLLLFLLFSSYFHVSQTMDLAPTHPIPYALKQSPRRPTFLHYIQNTHNDINSAQNPYLCTAALCNDNEVIHFLLQRPDVKIDATMNGHTALEYARNNKNREAIESLVKYENLQRRTQDNENIIASQSTPLAVIWSCFLLGYLCFRK